MTAGFVVQINDGLLYRSPDGREAWVLFNGRDGLAFICTDIYRTPVSSPEQAVGFTSAILRQIADRLDAMTEKEAGS